MEHFDVDDDVVALVWKLAKPKPFENPTFSDALRRVLHDKLAAVSAADLGDLEDLLKSAQTGKKSPSPNPSDWAAEVPELRNRKDLSTWKAICDYLRIDTAGDSARRKLKNWVKSNRPSWPAVPDID